MPSTMRALVVGLLFFATACDDPSSRSTSTASVELTGECTAGPVQLSGDPADPRSIVIENGIVRVSYPQLISGIDQVGSHMLELNVGGNWQRVLDDWYGDWTFFAAPFSEPARTAHVITETPDVVEVAFEFDHSLEFPGRYGTDGYIPSWWNEEEQGPCTVAAGCGCYLYGCGIVARDFEGVPVYPHNLLDTPKRIRHVQFTKVIRLERCASGYFVGYHSTPRLTGAWIEADPYDNGAGEREHGLGWMATVTWSSAGVVVRNPEEGHHASLGLVEQKTGPWWFASLPYDATHYPFVLFMAEQHPMPSFVWQFAPDHLGVPLVHKMNPTVGADGTEGTYQTFLGAAPYEMIDRAQEPTPSVQGLVTERLPAEWPR